MNLIKNLIYYARKKYYQLQAERLDEELQMRKAKDDFKNSVYKLHKLSEEERKALVKILQEANKKAEYKEVEK
jgi:hypothetical protein